MHESHTTIGSGALERARHIASSTWSDALDASHLDGVIDGLVVRCAGDMPVVGIAITVRERTHDLDASTVEQFDIARVLHEASADTFFVIDVGGANVSTFGGLAAKAAKLQGAVGVLVEGACRDLPEVQRSGLYVMSRHITPRSGKGRVSVESINAPVTIGGVTIEPGDVIVGDATGVVRIPRRGFLEMLEKAERLEERDARFAAALETSTFREVVKKVGPV